MLFRSRKSEYFIPLAEKHMQNRLDNVSNDWGIKLSYSISKKVYNNKNDFNALYGLESNKRNIFIMLHAFNDYPHQLGFLVYKDYCEWFKVILSIAKENNNANWIFKEHPESIYYSTKDINLEQLFSGIKNKNIVFLDRDADFNTSSLCHVCDVLCTCIGTAGIEYSTFGIPCVLGGRSWYSGFGFTVEPKTDSEFKDIINNINNITHLSIEQTNIAKLVAYFVFNVLEVTKFPDPFGTLVTSDLGDQRSLSIKKIFDIIISHRSKSSLEEKIRYINSIKNFIFNSGITQFIDYKENPFFEEVDKDYVKNWIY